MLLSLKSYLSSPEIYITLIIIALMWFFSILLIRKDIKENKRYKYTLKVNSNWIYIFPIILLVGMTLIIISFVVVVHP